MTTERIKGRSVVFRYAVEDWHLNLHLILGNRHNFLIDTGLGAGSVGPILQYVREDSKPVVVINTHHHWDHIWGNHAFDGCTIVSHGLCRELMLRKWDEMLERQGRHMHGEARLCLPNLVFTDTLEFPGDGVRIFHTPGHTADSVSVLDEADGVLNAGDNIGDTADEIVPSVGVGRGVFMETLEKYRNLTFDTCVSGHNVTLGKEVVGSIIASL